jgi:hypothetical protein
MKAVISRGVGLPRPWLNLSNVVASRYFCNTVAQARTGGNSERTLTVQNETDSTARSRASIWMMALLCAFSAPFVGLLPFPLPPPALEALPASESPSKPKIPSIDRGCVAAGGAHPSHAPAAPTAPLPLLEDAAGCVCVGGGCGTPPAMPAFARRSSIVQWLLTVSLPCLSAICRVRLLHQSRKIRGLPGGDNARGNSLLHQSRKNRGLPGGDNARVCSLRQSRKGHGLPGGNNARGGSLQLSVHVLLSSIVCRGCFSGLLLATVGTAQ